MDQKIELQMLARLSPDREVCGVITNTGRLIELPNTFNGDCAHGFDMEIDLVDGDVAIIWHSHPNGPPYPSTDDIPCIDLLASHGYNFNWIIAMTHDVFEYSMKADIIESAKSA